ncbi:MAG TPA: DinB family protein [Candidatus Limnocylindria bacterium]
MPFDLAQARAALERAPAVLDGLIAGLPDDWLAARTREGEWSAHQVVCHLAYVEETDWQVRARMIREVGEAEPFPPVDHGDQAARYAGFRTDGVARRFAAQRQANLAALDGLAIGDADLGLRGLHPSLGTVTMRQLLATWVVHDHNHLAQAHGALAAHYVDEVGPWRRLLGILDQVEP